MLMPVTAWTYFAACCAIAGFPLTSGFFSKDEILWKAFDAGNLEPVARALRAKFPHLQFVSIGPVTTKTAVEKGLPVAVEAKVHTIAGLVAAILECGNLSQLATTGKTAKR